jgi:PAS domain S-box-containing protein
MRSVRKSLSIYLYSCKCLRMESDEDQPAPDTDPPSVLFLAPGRTAAEAVETALSRHDIAVYVEYDIIQVLDNLPKADFECLVVPDGLAAMSSEELLDEIRDRDPFLPVVFLLIEPTNGVVDRIESAETADFLTGEIQSVSYDRLANRIRTLVANYRTSQARRTERDIVERLEDRLYQTERKITALHSVAMDLNTTSTVEEVYQETVRAAEEILDLDICFAFAADDDVFVPKARSSTSTDRDLEPVPLDAGVMGETYRTGESDRTVDMDLHTLAEPAFGDYQSGISVPIGEFGVFQAVSKEVGAFDEIDLELTELLTSHAAAVLQRLSFENELRIERDRYAALFRNSTDCILEAEFAGEDAIVRRVNPAFESVFGYDESEILGCAVDDVIVSEDKRERARDLTRQVQDGEFVQAEVRRQTNSGVRDFLLRSVPVDEDTLYAVYTDITDQKETERTIQNQKERLDAFTSTVSHDLRNPLNVAQGRLSLAREEHDSEHLQIVDEAHDRIETLIEDLLTLAREGDRALSIEPVSLSAVVDDCWEAVVTGDASLIVDAERTVYADEGQLRQLIENLMRNAVEHGGSGVTVTVGNCDGGFYVADTGSGIPEDRQDNIFDAGYSTSEDGTGFGLSIVNQVIEDHGWAINLTESSAGGARFEITGVGIME